MLFKKLPKLFSIPLLALSFAANAQSPKATPAPNTPATTTPAKTTITKDNVKVVECRIPFKVNQFTVDAVKLKNCFKKLKKENLESFDVYATASPDGKASKNNILAENRKKAIEEQLNKIFPGVAVNAKSGGQNRSLMRSALIVAVMREQSVTQIAAQPTPPAPTCPVVAEKVCPVVPEKVCPVFVPPKPEIKNLGINFWLGFDVIMPTSKVKNYAYNPFYGFEFGFSKEFYKLNNVSHLYYSGIYNSGLSNKDIGKDSNGNNLTAIYFISNFQGSFGAEYKYLNNMLGVYADLGPAVQQRSLIARSATTAINNYFISTTFGGTFNLGLNTYYEYSKTLQILMKINLNGTIGIPKDQVLDTDTININPFIFTPSISFGVRL